MARILIVDGNGADSSRLLAWLDSVGHICRAARDGASALELLGSQQLDLVLTEWRLPDMSGLELADAMRRLPQSFLSRIIIISGQLDPQAIAAALDNGIDDVLPKHCQLPELLARIHAALRRPPTATPDGVLEVGPLRLEKRNHQVSVDSKPLTLAPAEFRLMAYFMENPGRVLPRQQLLEQVWRKRKGIGERTVDVHVRRLRAALEPHACEHLLQTVRGYGYRFGG